MKTIKIENHIFTENDNRKNRISILAKSEHRACKVVKIKYPKINYCYNGIDKEWTLKELIGIN